MLSTDVRSADIDVRVVGTDARVRRTNVLTASIAGRTILCQPPMRRATADAGAREDHARFFGTRWIVLDNVAAGVDRERPRARDMLMSGAVVSAGAVAPLVWPSCV